MLEKDYQRDIIERLHDEFPGCFVLKNDSGYLQGVPDLTVLYREYWAVLEVKLSAKASERPNQRHYITVLDEMSFAAFIFPENEDEGFHALQQAFRPRRASRVPKRQ